MSGKKTTMDVVFDFLYGVLIGIIIYFFVHLFFPYEPLTHSEMETLKTIYPELHERLLISRLGAICYESWLFFITVFPVAIAIMVTAAVASYIENRRC